MAIFVVGLFIVVGGIVAIAFPLFRPDKEESNSELQGEELEILSSRKESYYSAIKELEFDFKSKKLSQEDYEGLREEYKTLALEAISQIDELESEKGQKGGRVEKEEKEIKDDWIEEEVRKIRESRSKRADEK